MTFESKFLENITQKESDLLDSDFKNVLSYNYGMNIKTENYRKTSGSPQWMSVLNVVTFFTL